MNFQMFKLVLEKAEESEIKICQYQLTHRKTKRIPENIYFCFIDYAKTFNCGHHNELWKILQEMEYQTTWPASWETCVQVRKQQLELDMEQQTGSK